MIALDKATAEDFAPLVDSVFSVPVSGGAAIALRPGNVMEIPYVDPKRRRGFSLVFVGPESPALPQRTYRLEHALSGPLELFLVPVQPDARGPLYEAVFN